MVIIGRAVAAVGVGGAIVLFTVLATVGEGGTVLSNVLGVTGALVAFSMFAAWLLAIWHWGSRYPSGRPGKGFWGLVVVCGFVLGATAYWFIAAGRPSEPGDLVTRSAAEG